MSSPAPATPSTHRGASEAPSPSASSEGRSVSAPPLTSIPLEVENAEPEERVSFYVQAVDDMIGGVLDQEQHLFTTLELKALDAFQHLEYNSRYLFARLYLRKFGAWFRQESLYESYGDEIGDIKEPMDNLCEVMDGMVIARRDPMDVDEDKPKSDEMMLDLTGDTDDEEDEKKKHRQSKGKGRATSAPEDDEEDDINADYSCFAYNSASMAEHNTREVLSNLSLKELAALATKMRLPAPKGPKTLQTWTDALLKTSNQATLGFSPVPKSNGKAVDHVLGIGFDKVGRPLSQEKLVEKAALGMIGDCIRLNPSYVTLLDRVSLLYHRKSISSSGTTALTDALLARFGKRTYPEYVTKRSFSLFKSRKHLKEYESALKLERLMEEATGENWKERGVKKIALVPPVEKKGAEKKRQEKKIKAAGDSAPKLKRLEDELKLRKEVEDRERAERLAEMQNALKEFEAVRARWAEMCVEERKASRLEKEQEGKAVLYYRRRFHPGWILTRVAYKAAVVHAKLGDHTSEKEIYEQLLKQKVFRLGKRGAWWDRLALLHQNYADQEELDIKDDDEREVMTKGRLKTALKVCLEGLKDENTHLVYRADLQRRVARLERSLKVPIAKLHKVDRVLSRSVTSVVEGIRTDIGEAGRHSTWKDPSAEDGVELEDVSVEEVALQSYLQQEEGWKGFHSENSILTTIFALLFWDVLFAPINGVFETAYQSAPLDLATDSFSLARHDLIQARRAEIENGDGPKILSEVDDRERPKKTFCVGVSWDRYSKKDLMQIVRCLGGEALAELVVIYAEEYGHRSGGVPDLCLWNHSTRTVKFVEVKGPGDTLSTTQKVWIDLMLRLGIPVEVCKVMTSDEIELAEGKKRKAKKEGNGKKGGKGKGKKRKRKGEESEEEEDGEEEEEE